MMVRTSTKLSLSLLLVTSCAGEVDRPRGGGTVESGFDEHGLYVANVDHGTVSRIDLNDGAVQTFETGREPTRIARTGNRVYVSNRLDRNVAVFEDDGFILSRIGTIDTGAEPFGVVATERSVYVSASIDGRVIEYDADSFAETRSWDIAGEPRGIALHHSGQALYVAATYGGKWTYLNLKSGAAREFSLPALSGFNFETGAEFPLRQRITGDPAVNVSGDTLAIPGLFLDRDTVIPDDDNGEGMVPGGGGYGGRFNPAVVVINLDIGTGEPDVDTMNAYSVVGFVMDPLNGFFRSVSGYPVSVSFTPDNLGVVVVEGADAVQVVDFDQHVQITTDNGGADAAPGIAFPGGGGRGLNFLPMVSVTTGAGPVGAAVLNDDVAYVHALFDRRAQRIDLEAARQLLRGNNTSGETRPAPGGGSFGGGGSGVQLRANAGYTLGDEVLETNVARGRRLFFATGNPTMSGDGSGVSCATCHFQGRTDGITWNFETNGLRQTPSLAGKVSRYEPVGWEGDRETVAIDAMLTSQGLMGGEGLTERDTLDIAAYVDWSRDIDNTLRGTDEERYARGAALFARPDVACTTCHAGAAHTNNQNVPLFGLESAKVRPLNGVRSTAPYLHDGSAATIRDLLERVRDGSMGNTSALSDAEMSDLEFFVLSL